MEIFNNINVSSINIFFEGIEEWLYFDFFLMEQLFKLIFYQNKILVLTQLVIESVPQTFTEEQLNILIGTLLGDGWIQVDRSKKIITNARYAFAQSGNIPRHKSYVDHVLTKLKNFCTETRKATFRKSDNFSKYEFTTRTLDVFFLLYQIFYYFDPTFMKQQIKSIPRPLLEKIITPEIIAYLYMDDGNQQDRSFVISTNSFTFEDNIWFADLLRRKFGIFCHVYYSQAKQRNMIYISAFSHNNFIDLIEPYMVPEMKYKLKPIPRLIKANKKLNDLNVHNRYIIKIDEIHSTEKNCIIGYDVIEIINSVSYNYINKTMVETFFPVRKISKRLKTNTIAEFLEVFYNQKR